MADVYPIKVNRVLGDTDSLGEFEAGETVPVDAGGTGADNAPTARSNLGALGAGDDVTLLDGTPDQMLYIDSAGNVTEFALGNSGEFLQSTGLTSAPTWVASSSMGDVDGPASSTDEAVARFDGVTGKLIQNSAVLIDDTGNISGVVNLTLSGTVDGRDVSADGSTLDGHVADATIHFTEASIDHTAITNIGVNSHAAIDTHIADATIHFTEASIDHTAISNIGLNSHAAIDSHIADATIHFTEGSIDHTAILNIGTNSHAAIDTHIADGTIHFTEGSIDHLNILNIGVNSHAQIDTHIADATIHFTEASIDHTAILNVGSNTHAQIDTHIADASIHFTEASIDHTAILNVGSNTHAQIDTHIADTDIHFSDAPADGNDYVRNNNTWALITGMGDVVGPASATDNAIARYDGVTGKLIQDSLLTINDTGTLFTNDIEERTPAAGITLTADDGGGGGNGTANWDGNMLTLDSADGGDNLLLGYGPTGDGATPNAYQLGRSGVGGYLAFMPFAGTPQIMIGDDTDTGAAFWDGNGNKDLNFQTLDTGPGTAVNKLTRFGPGGLALVATAGGNEVFVQVPNIAADYTLTLPVDDGTLNQGLVTDGAGVLSWADVVFESRTLTAGLGLTGGGDLSADRTFDVGGGNGITANADDIEVNVTNSIEIVTDNLQLVNDEASPGNHQYYGTNGTGVKGWQDGPEVLQVVRKNVTAVLSTTAEIIMTDPAPTSTDGTAIDSESITMLAAANRVRIQASFQIGVANDGRGVVITVHRGTTMLAVYNFGNVAKSENASNAFVDIFDSPGAGTHTYSFRFATDNSTAYINQSDSDATPYGGTLFTNGSQIVLSEVRV